MIQDCYLTISQNFANRFSEMYQNQDLEAQNSEARISGVKGVSYTKVKDFEIEISKERFFQLGDVEPVDVDHVIQKIWSDLNHCSHEGILETIITDCIRRKNIFCDCNYIKTNNLKITFYVRDSAELVTQKPTNFAHLYRESFDYLHEVQQGEYAITDKNSKKPVLATWHLAECVAFVAIELFSKIGIVAHIDTCADVEDFFTRLKQRLNLQPFSEVEYILIGGQEREYGYDHPEKIKSMAEKASDVFVKFRLVQEIGEKIPSKVFQKDSSWGISVRLNRSVALDLREDNPLINLKSYEARINENSSLLKRTFSKQEAYLFESKRERERVLSLSYDGVAGI